MGEFVARSMAEPAPNRARPRRKSITEASTKNSRAASRAGDSVDSMGRSRRRRRSSVELELDAILKLASDLQVKHAEVDKKHEEVKEYSDEIVKKAEEMVANTAGVAIAAVKWKKKLPKAAKDNPKELELTTEDELPPIESMLLPVEAEEQAADDEANDSRARVRVTACARARV